MKRSRRAWDGYWTTKIGWAAEGRILVRGYRAEELIRHATFAEAAYLVIRGDLPSEVQAAALDAVFRSGLDQAFINSAVPAARFAASAAPESPAAAIAAGVIAFGSVTGSPRPCAEMLIEAHGAMVEEGLAPAAAARRVVEAHARRGARIPGIGHPLHKRIEPRAPLPFAHLGSQTDRHGGGADQSEEDCETSTEAHRGRFLAATRSITASSATSSTTVMRNTVVPLNL